jgi:hypothetical protein
MAGIAPLAAVVARPLLARVAGSLAGRAAGSLAAKEVAGGGVESALGRVASSLPMPMPHLGSSGGSNQPPVEDTTSVLNADQFR